MQQQPPQIIFNQKDIIGEGAYSIVFSGKFGNDAVAIKRVQLPQANTREKDCFETLDHPNIIKLLHYESDSSFIYFALELCEASVYQLFLKDSDPEKYKQSKLPYHLGVFLELARGLDYIHSKQLIHRDIKPDNVLISVYSNADCNRQVKMKWADFGLSRTVNERGTYTMNTIKGTQYWRAPELLKQIEDEEMTDSPPIKLRGTNRSDVFAEGLLFGYYFSDGKHPYGLVSAKIESNILKNKQVNVTDKYIRSSHVRDLMQQMLESDPNNRMTSSKVVNELEAIIGELKKKEETLFELLGASSVNVDEVKALIHEGVDINCTNQGGCTPFLYLTKVSSGKTNLKDTMSMLLGLNWIICPIDVNIKEKSGYNALHFLCMLYWREDLIDIIRLLIQHGITVDSTEDKENWNALHFLCENYQKDNLIELIRLLTDNGIDVKKVTKDEWNALHFVCHHYENENLIDIVELLIHSGIIVDATEKDDWNALHFLCQNYKQDNLINIVRLLINKTDVNSKTNKQWNALHLACKNYKNENLLEIIKLLIEKGIIVQSSNNEKQNALHLLCENYNENNTLLIVELLIENGINVNSKDKDGWNALHILCQNYKKENLFDIVKLLIVNGIKVNIKTNEGWNALFILCQHNQSNQKFVNLVQLLIENGTDVNWKNKNGWNILHFLCKNYCHSNLVDIVRHLIFHQIDVNCTTNEGNALHLLCRYYNNPNLIEIIKFLKAKGIPLKCNNIDPQNLPQSSFNEASKRNMRMAYT